MLGVEDQRGVHGADEHLAGRLAVQQVQEVPADAVVVGLHVDPLAVVGVVEPVEQRGTEAGHQPVGDVACARLVLVVLLRQHAAERRDGGAHHVHRMRCGRQRLQHLLDRGRKAAQRAQLRLVAGEFGARRQRRRAPAGRRSPRTRTLGDVEDVVAAIVQVVAGAPDGAQRGVAGGDAGQSDAFLCPVGNCGGVAHDVVSFAVLGRRGRPCHCEEASRRSNLGAACAHWTGDCFVAPLPAMTGVGGSDVRISPACRRRACRRAGQRSIGAARPPSGAAGPARPPGSGSPRASR